MKRTGLHWSPNVKTGTLMEFQNKNLVKLVRVFQLMAPNAGKAMSVELHKFNTEKATSS